MGNNHIEEVMNGVMHSVCQGHFFFFFFGRIMEFADFVRSFVSNALSFVLLLHQVESHYFHACL